MKNSIFILGLLVSSFSFSQLENAHETLQVKECSEAYLTNPYWMSGLNKLFTRCPEMKVGIGTLNPEYTLDVRGYGYFSSGVKVGSISSPSLPAYFDGYASIANARPWMRFTVLENGQDKTAFLVEKNGGLYCTSVRVRLRDDIPVPDYVFKSNYKLMPLDKVKEYVKANSHLPNIPSEKEIKEKGLNIDEMQLKLLEKIEELTLYVIQLKEENELIRQEIELMKQ
ncbi:MAG: hypothetical protein MK105_05595 [Crocinitomicaceae bacterium]|nr:hypothetical protein [Crocinitomicaceae bacterium]